MPHAALLERIAQFGGVWINSNMPGITAGSPLHPLPEYDVVEVASRSGGHRRRVAVLGLLCDYAQLSRKSAFNGLAAAGGIEPPIDALKRLAGALRDAEKPDAVVAMTHLLDPEDDAICATGLCDAVLGGHDHAVTARASSGVPLAKAGMDATHAVVMDLSWGDARAATPAIRATVERTADFAPDAALAARVASHLAKVEAMDEMVLSSVRRVRRDLFPGLRVDAAAASRGRRASLRRSAADATPPLTSVGVRNGERSMATLLASIVAAELGADCCVLEAGGVRGNATYEASLTFAHLKAELPFENLMAVVPVDGASLSAFVRDSRDRPDLQSPRGYAFFLHGDVGLTYCPERKAVTTVRGEPLDPARLYTVANCLDLGFGSGKNAAMAAYAARHGDRLPDRDAAIPAKTLVMKYLCRELWKLLPAFDDVDADRSGFLDRDEVKRTYVAALMAVHDDGAPECEAEKIAAENMVDQLIACLDTNSDGKVDRREYAAVAHGAH